LARLGSIIQGLLTPSIAIVLSENAKAYDPNNTEESTVETLRIVVILICYIMGFMWVGAYMNYALWQHLAEKLSMNLRTVYLRKLMEQEIEFFEKQSVQAIPSDMGRYFIQIG
jgi:ABC-type multidrug transport system fused ATPase/permease subunit